ncbi:MAG: CHAT domain-containing protein [Brevundimonas sp.]|uniref:CHAT domain-containing protein n=1 Tax=Brevundimonas sp. TaxID=1871086 RepID=UPI002735D5B4|nr:CHAT domain-containing protein [Brevundimonas sp.]MDP3656739.1 CHAT domain-containing protein [Brevundimonas sp.]
MIAARLARCLGSLAALVAVFAASPAPARQETPAALRAEAYEAAQWAIASDAADALARVSARFAQGDDALGRLAEEREDLIERRDRLERELERLYASEEATALAARARTRTAWEAAVERLRAVDADIEARFPAYSELTSPRALSIAETQALLGPDEGLLLVLVNPEATYVWGISRERVEWARADDLGDAAMTEAVNRLRASLTSAGAVRGGQDIDPIVFAGPQATPFDRATAHRLYTELVQPVEGAFQGKKTLISVVTGALTSLPLSVLTTASPTGSDAAPEALAATPWLIDRYALATLPSVSSLEALRCHLVADPALRSPGCPPRRNAVARRADTRGARLHLAAFGAPLLTGEPRAATRGSPTADDVMGEGRLADVGKLRALPALPGSKLELETLKTRYPGSLVRIGSEATEHAVRADDAEALSRARFVVFSTHGLMAGSAAAEPGLVMTPPEQATEADDGYLSASEAAQLRLNAEFVVLSACNTAASNGRPGGEGLSGLARAFFYAGARSVMVSHWEVSDAATTTLITSAFADLDDNRAGDPGVRARALQAGIRAVRAERRWAHPAYWAAFTLVGEPG